METWRITYYSQASNARAYPKLLPIPIKGPRHRIAPMVQRSHGPQKSRRSDRRETKRPKRDKETKETEELTDERTRGQAEDNIVLSFSSFRLYYHPLPTSVTVARNMDVAHCAESVRNKKNGYIYEKSFTLSIGCRIDDTYSLGTRVAATTCVARV